jgi:hypothetical protein
MMEWVRNPIARRWRYPRIKAEMSGACALEDGGAGCLLMAKRSPARAQLDIAAGNPRSGTDLAQSLPMSSATVSERATRFQKSMSDMVAATGTIRPVLDHVVINVMGKLDEAAAQYTRLGFQLTERGHHTLGSSNNLAIFGTNYLELLGYLPGRETMRADLWAHPAGLTGLVFKSVDAELVYSNLKERGVAVMEPMSFARPVALSDNTKDARFKVIRIAGDEVRNGRTFFCHHDTPELVYRPEWQSHPNGVTGIAEFVIAAREPARTAALYERMFGPDVLTPVSGGVSFQTGTARVLVLEPAAVAERYAGAALVSEDGSDRMVALAFKVASIAAPHQVFDGAGIAYRPYASGIVVAHADAAGVALGFTA